MSKSELCQICDKRPIDREIAELKICDSCLDKLWNAFVNSTTSSLEKASTLSSLFIGLKNRYSNDYANLFLQKLANQVRR